MITLYIKHSKCNVIDAKINPRLLEADQFSEVLEIRENADVQQRVLRMSFTQEVKEAGEFWNKIRIRSSFTCKFRR